MPQITDWTKPEHIEQIAQISGTTGAEVIARLSAFPTGVNGVALVDGSSVVGAGITVERDLVPHGRLNLSQVVLKAGAGTDAVTPLVDWMERRGRELGAERVRLSSICIAVLGPLMLERGYTLVESYITLERKRPFETPPLLPDGLQLVDLSTAGVPAFLEITNSSFAQVPGTFPLTIDDWERTRNEPGFDEGLIRVLMEKGQPIGFLRGNLKPDRIGEVDSIGLSAGTRGRGLGLFLLRVTEQLLRERGMTRVQLLVAASNTNAVKLYHREGYQEIDRREAWERAL